MLAQRGIIVSYETLLTFDDLAAWYLDDYVVRRLRTLDTARGRVANLRRAFGGWPAPAIRTVFGERYPERVEPDCHLRRGFST